MYDLAIHPTVWMTNQFHSLATTRFDHSIKSPVRWPARRLSAILGADISRNDLAETRKCTHRGWTLGGERMREQIGALSVKVCGQTEKG